MPNANPTGPEVTVSSVVPQPPIVAEASSHDTDVENYIQQLEKEYADEQFSETEVTTEDQSQEDEESGKSGESETKETKADDPLARIVAKENEFKAEKAKWETEAVKFKEEKAKWEQEKKSLINPQDLIDLVSLDPHDFFTRLGVDSETVMKQMLYAKMSDDNPAKGRLRADLRDLEHKKEIRKLRDELSAKEVAASTAAEYQKVFSGARQYVETLKGSKDAEAFPNVSLVAADPANTEWLQKRVMSEISNDAASRLARGETGDPIDYKTALSRIEEDWKVLAKYFGSKKEKTVETKAADEKVVSDSNIKPSAPKKNPNEFTIQELEERALKEGIATYNRLEATRRAGKAK